MAKRAGERFPELPSSPGTADTTPAFLLTKAVRFRHKGRKSKKLAPILWLLGNWILSEPTLPSLLILSMRTPIPLELEWLISHRLHRDYVFNGNLSPFLSSHVPLTSTQHLAEHRCSCIGSSEAWRGWKSELRLLTIEPAECQPTAETVWAQQMVCCTFVSAL